MGGNKITKDLNKELDYLTIRNREKLLAKGKRVLKEIDSIGKDIKIKN